jgi:2-desacetyl-2-hydroxyethyl bacteriochlorophyllide A dehydrogenase
MTMQALVFNADAEIDLSRRPVPEPTEGRVLIAVERCGICGTDLHAAQMMDFIQAPVVLGHEFTGVVSAVGPGVEGFAAGDAVVVNPCGAACGECRACRAGLTNLCLVMMGGESYGLQRDGGMAEYAQVPAGIVHRRPAGMSATTAAWTEPLSVAYRGVSRGGVAEGSTVAILGAGPIGQLALQVAKAAGAAELLVIETSQFRREVAVRCGASETISPQELDTADRYYDVVLDCTGAPAAVNTDLELVEYGGQIVIIGTNTSPVTIDQPMLAQLKEADFAFSLCYRDEHEFATSLEMLDRGEIDVEPLTTAVMPLAEHADAFAAQRDPESAIKLVLDPTA